MQAEIVINPFLGYNTAPQYFNVPLNTVGLNSVNYYNPSVIESEGDSLYYQLIPAAGNNITGFNFPPATSSFSIDSLTGTVTWDKPTMLCSYSYDIRIKEYRNLGGIHYYIGSTMQDVFNNVSAEAGINDLRNDETISIYPNPAQSEIVIEFTASTSNIKETKNVLIEIKNVLGQTLKTINYTSFSDEKNKIEVDLTNYPKGLYFVLFYNENKMFSKRLVKQ